KFRAIVIALLYFCLSTGIFCSRSRSLACMICDILHCDRGLDMYFAISRWMYAIGLSLCISASAQHAPETKIEIDARKAASYTIPRTIFGTFLEPIGNSTYNGLWAELLQN